MLPNMRWHLGDPHKPFDTPDWLRSLLKGQDPSFKNKLAAIGKCVNKKFIEDNMVKVEHPAMSTYQRIVQRVRAVNGFKEWPLLYKLVIDGAPGRTPVGGRAGCGFRKIEARRAGDRRAE